MDFVRVSFLPLLARIRWMSVSVKHSHTWLIYCNYTLEYIQIKRNGRESSIFVSWWLIFFGGFSVFSWVTLKHKSQSAMLVRLYCLHYQLEHFLLFRTTFEWSNIEHRRREIVLVIWPIGNQTITWFNRFSSVCMWKQWIASKHI